MIMSCNGCRVLRKRCSDGCELRSSLKCIKGAEAQANATAFVAKFFGRATLANSLSAVPETQRPALFISLLYEACGRTVNPVHGAVGLLCSGNWQACQAAAEAVLKGHILQPIIKNDDAQRAGIQYPACSFAPRSSIAGSEPQDKATLINSTQPERRCRTFTILKQENYAEVLNMEHERNSTKLHTLVKSLKRKHGDIEKGNAQRASNVMNETLLIAEDPKIVEEEAIIESDVSLELTLSSYNPAKAQYRPSQLHNCKLYNWIEVNNSYISPECNFSCNSLSSESSMTSLTSSNTCSCRMSGARYCGCAILEM